MIHGYARRGKKTPEYLIWIAMRQRCLNPRSKRYADYGGRGIKICARWNSFDNFIFDMGPRPSPEHTLNRRNNDGHYNRSNCRWSTYKEQCNNTRRNIVVKVDGRKMTLMQAVELKGVRYGTVLYRIKAGWSIERALR